MVLKTTLSFCRNCIKYLMRLTEQIRDSVTYKNNEQLQFARSYNLYTVSQKQSTTFFE